MYLYELYAHLDDENVSFGKTERQHISKYHRGDDVKGG